VTHVCTCAAQPHANGVHESRRILKLNCELRARAREARRRPLPLPLPPSVGRRCDGGVFSQGRFDRSYDPRSCSSNGGGRHARVEGGLGMPRLRGDLCTHSGFFIHGRVKHMRILRCGSATRPAFPLPGSLLVANLCREFAETCRIARPSSLAGKCGIG